MEQGCRCISSLILSLKLGASAVPYLYSGRRTLFFCFSLHQLCLARRLHISLPPVLYQREVYITACNTTIIVLQSHKLGSTHLWNLRGTRLHRRPATFTNMPIAPPLNVGWGYGIVLGLGAVFAFGSMYQFSHVSINFLQWIPMKLSLVPRPRLTVTKW